MSRRLLFLAEFLLVGCTPWAQVAARPLPADVAAFAQRRETCDHFRGEEPYDRARAAEIATELARSCAGTDRALAALRRKYANDRKVIKRLSHYEERVE